MIPKKIQPYFEMMRQTKNGDNWLVEGLLFCCNSHNFEVFAVGKIKYGIFSKMYLFSDNDKIVIKARCKKCGRVIKVFDEKCDGYEHCGKVQFSTNIIEEKEVGCKKCQNSDFLINIKYEYFDDMELDEFKIAEIDNAFSWIWITLECNNCGTKYKNFVDCETT